MDARLEQLLVPRHDRVRRHGPEKANEEILREMRERLSAHRIPMCGMPTSSNIGPRVANPARM